MAVIYRDNEGTNMGMIVFLFCANSYTWSFINSHWIKFLLPNRQKTRISSIPVISLNLQKNLLSLRSLPRQFFRLSSAISLSISIFIFPHIAHSLFFLKVASTNYNMYMHVRRFCRTSDKAIWESNLIPLTLFLET